MERNFEIAATTLCLRVNFEECDVKLGGGPLEKKVCELYSR